MDFDSDAHEAYPLPSYNLLKIIESFSFVNVRNSSQVRVGRTNELSSSFLDQLLVLLAHVLLILSTIEEV